MLTVIRKFLSLPRLPQDEEKARTAQILNFVLLTLLGTIGMLLIWILYSDVNGQPQNPALYGITIIAVLAFLGLWLLLRRGYVNGIGLTVVILLTVALLFSGFAVGTLRTPGLVAMLMVVTAIAGLTAGRATMIASAIANSVMAFVITWAEINGMLPPVQPVLIGGVAISFSIVQALFVALLGLALTNLESSLKQGKESRRLLELSNLDLERQVNERTRALTASIEVSRRLSTILHQDQLIVQVVEQIKQAFDYYHVHIYLNDEKSQGLIMAGGTGEVGQTLLAQGHKIQKGKGLVGRAAETRGAVLVSDTSSEADWLPNPLLPDTKSEIAVPIILGNETLGVLDVQHNTINGLGQEDANLLQSIAYQVAIALKNAQTISSIQRQIEREYLVSAINKKIQNTTTVEHALQVAIQELGTALDVREAQVTLERPDVLIKQS